MAAAYRIGKIDIKKILRGKTEEEKLQEQKYSLEDRIFDINVIKRDAEELERSPLNIADEHIDYIYSVFDIVKSDIRQAKKKKDLVSLKASFKKIANIIDVSKAKIDTRRMFNKDTNIESLKYMKKTYPLEYEELKQSILLNNENDYKAPAKNWNTHTVKKTEKLMKKCISIYDKMSSKYKMGDLGFASIYWGGVRLYKVMKQIKKLNIKPSNLLKTAGKILAAPLLIVYLSYSAHISDIKKINQMKQDIVFYEQKIDENYGYINKLATTWQKEESAKAKHKKKTMEIASMYTNIKTIEKQNKRYLELIDGTKNSVNSLTNEWEYFQWEKTGLFGRHKDKP